MFKRADLDERRRSGRYLLQQLGHPLQRGADVLHAVVVGEAQVSLAVGPEAGAGNHRDPGLFKPLAVAGSAWLREQQPYELLAFVDACLAADPWRQRAQGFLALETLLARTDFPDLPAVFKLLESVPGNLQKQVRPYWAEAYRPLIARTPRESLYHLQQRLNASDEAGLRWLARNLLDQFPADEQAELRAAL